ncbi:MAG: VCBS repeat-containing protein, partial [Thermoplasmata archaeon]|nr:VCBS repeat-containing protein [Thermoplasmata archaeon]
DDSDLDIAVANYDGAITIWYNNGDGTYYGRIDYKLGVETFSVLAKDLDKDNDIELVVSIEFNFTIGVIFNNGDGTFDIPNRHLYEIGGNPYSLVAKDINNDTWPDLIASTTYQHAIFYSLNKGDGTFKNFTKIDMGEHLTFDIAAVDVDGDNDVDIIATNLGEDDDPEKSVSIIFNRGDGTFSETYIDYMVGDGPIGVTAADFNNDGRPDIATANRGTDTVSILFNKGNGTFGNEIDYAAGKEPYGIYCKDINHDGNIDILVPNHRGNSVSVFVNDGNGEFNNLNYEFLVGSGPTKLVVADVNNDGSEDIITVNLNTNTASIHTMIYYPADVKVDLGNDGDGLVNYIGYLTKSTTFKNIFLVDELNDYLEDARNDGVEGDVEIPIKITADGQGVVELSQLSIRYTMEPIDDIPEEDR